MQSRSIGPAILRASRRGHRRRAGRGAGRARRPPAGRGARGRAAGAGARRRGRRRCKAALRRRAGGAAGRPARGDRRLLRGARLCPVLDRAGQRTAPPSWPRRSTRAAAQALPRGALRAPTRWRCSSHAPATTAPRPRARGGGDAAPTCASRPTSRRACSMPSGGQSRTSAASRRAPPPAALLAALDDAPVAEALAGLRAAGSRTMRRLIAEKARLEALARTGAWGPAVADGPTLHPGDERPAGGGAAGAAGAARLRRARRPRLAGDGFDDGAGAGGADVPARLRPRTTTAWSGAMTLAAMNAPVETRLAQVVVNLERMRWMNARPRRSAISSSTSPTSP